jgi:hypothetical protein
LSQSLTGLEEKCTEATYSNKELSNQLEATKSGINHRFAEFKELISSPAKTQLETRIQALEEANRAKIVECESNISFLNV